MQCLLSVYAGSYAVYALPVGGSYAVYALPKWLGSQVPILTSLGIQLGPLLLTLHAIGLYYVHVGL